MEGSGSSLQVTSFEGKTEKITIFSVVLGFRVLGFRVLGFSVLGFRV